jgi:hypothetical protein
LKRIKIRGQIGSFVIVEPPYPELGDYIEGRGNVVSITEEEGVVLRFGRVTVEKAQPERAGIENEAKP